MRLAGLADRDDERGAVEDRVAVAELARRTRPRTGSRVQCSMAYLATSPAWYDVPQAMMKTLSIVAQLVVGEAQLVERSGRRRQPAQQGVGDRLRLLGDLLEHEVVVAALLGGRGVPVDVVRLGLGRARREVGDGDAVAAQLDDLVLVELDRRAGVRDEGGDVGGEEVLARRRRPTTSGELRRAPTRTSGASACDGHEREGALQTAADAAQRLGEVGARAVELARRAGGRRPRCRSRR